MRRIGSGTGWGCDEHTHEHDEFNESMAVFWSDGCWGIPVALKE